MSESSDSEKNDSSFTITKKSLNKAIALLSEDETLKDEKFGGRKSMRECQLPSLQAQNMCTAAQIFSKGDNLTREITEELRTSLLENNFSGAKKLLEWLLQCASKPMLPILWKSAVVLFLNEHCSSEEILNEFLEVCADLRLPEDKRQFINLLVSLPDPEMFGFRTKKLSRSSKTSDATDSRSVTENEDDPCYVSH